MGSISKPAELVKSHRVGPRQDGPPPHTPQQRDFVLEVLRRAGSAGISKSQFREGSHPLLHGRRVGEPGARVHELEADGFKFEHRRDDKGLVVYALVPSEPEQPNLFGAETSASTEKKNTWGAISL